MLEINSPHHHQFLLPKRGTGLEIIPLQRPLSWGTMDASAQYHSANSFSSFSTVRLRVFPGLALFVLPQPELVFDRAPSREWLRAPRQKIRAPVLQDGNIGALALYRFTSGLQLGRINIFDGSTSREWLRAPGSMAKISGLQGTKE